MAWVYSRVRFAETMYSIPSQAGVAKVVIDGSVITGDSEPLVVYQDAPKVASDDS